jgi:hypothetical protein
VAESRTECVFAYDEWLIGVRREFVKVETPWRHGAKHISEVLNDSELLKEKE